MSPTQLPATPTATLVAREVSKSFGPRVVLDHVSLTVGPGRRVGVVAPNGAGKTTLLRILAGLEAPDTGRVQRMPPTATVGYLPQVTTRRPGETLHAFLARRTGVAEADRELAVASDALASGGEDADDRYATALDRYLALGTADFDARAAATVADVGLEPTLLGVEMAALSGGQVARAALAAIVLSRFDVLLLDEPTNDLDFAGLDRLERFATAFAGGLLVVSHDRAFLERTITDVLELDPHTHTAAQYAGGWVAYLGERELARRHAQEAYAAYRTRRDTLAGRAQRQREWSVQGVRSVKKGGERDKFIRHFRTQSSEHVAAKARITDRALARLDAEAVDKPWEGWELRMTLADAGRSGDVVAELRGAVVHRGDFTLGPVDLDVGFGERVAITGPNGSGKTTLLRALLGHQPLAAGTARLGPSVVVGELDQGRALLGGGGPALETFQAHTGLDTATARSTLAKFGLGAEHVARHGTTLSPGERTRAVLALFVARGVNCLVLDEPTNHLDLPAIEQLEQALETFPGTVLLVTHDRRLFDAVRLTRVVELHAGQVVADRPQLS